MAVAPHLGRVGEVGADLDEAGSEVSVQQVEVPHADPALLLHELEPHRPRSRLVGAVLGPEDPLHLLGRHDRHHPEAALALRRLQVGHHVVQLAVVEAGPVRLLQPENRDLPLRREVLDRLAEAVAVLLEQRRGGDGIAPVAHQELHDLAAHLQVGDVGVQVQAVDAGQLHGHVALKDIVDRDRTHSGPPLLATGWRQDPMTAGLPRVPARAGLSGPTDDPATGLGGVRGEGLPSSR